MFCVAVTATLNYMEEININAKGIKVGAKILEAFNAFKEKFPKHISDVRGLGAMMAFELSIDGNITKPDTELCKKLVQRCYEKGLIVLSAGVYGNVIRNLAPLVIEEDDLLKGLLIIEESLMELTQ